MSSVIKFRAWEEKQNRWLVGVELKEIGLVTLNLLPNFLILQNENTESVVLEQFTGLLDKNGKDIYEGDVVRQHPDFIGIDPRPAVVKYEAPQFVAENADYDDPTATSLKFVGWEVIGNIHENPELLP